MIDGGELVIDGEGRKRKEGEGCSRSGVAGSSDQPKLGRRDLALR